MRMRFFLIAGLVISAGLHAADLGSDTSEVKLVSWTRTSPPIVRYNGETYVVVETRFERMRKDGDIKKMKKVKTPQVIRDFLTARLEENSAREKAAAQKR